ncbi:MAG: DUF106 domain-containing protein [Thermoplasmata archaeon]|uniref:DUF106 domain-containing protein n=1 Tax=Candidatus Sysuiplasma superficiale TaxID=2823368 RepID=A0A8J7YJM3_9ARCH|nr:DUF106 domain-containing protein [Candidatus Sysuiplasma superficiale]MBX8644205.1 DUF106 domain-containing protein [Candidatus Sysuiplasma superficiale]MCL4347240.1 EMC3/TMCO1 family protein [Candidatus Thermoplasmatota archaeon]
MSSSQPQQPQMPQGTGQMFAVMIFMLVMLFAFLNPAVRSASVRITGDLLVPLIGFGGRFPTITIMIAELVVVFLGTTLRVFYTDFVEQARLQKTLSELRKHQREAFKTRDQTKIRKLQQVQSSYMMQNTQLMNKQFKVLPITIIIIFPLFAWLSVFLLSLPYPVFAVPWAPRVYFGQEIIFFPAWVFLYGLLGLPFTIVYQRLLRFFILRRRLERMGQRGSSS